MPSIHNLKASDERHLLMIVHRIPYPPDKGDKIRSYNEFKFLLEKGWKIHLCSFVDDEADLSHVQTLQSQCVTSYFQRIRKSHRQAGMAAALIMGKPLSVGAFFIKGAYRYVEQVLSAYPVQVVFCYSSPTAEYVFRSQNRNGFQAENHHATGVGTRGLLVMDLIDVDSEKWKQYSGQCRIPRRWIYRLESRRLAKYEKRIVNSFDATMVVSKNEAGLLKQKVGEGKKVHGISNGVDTEYFHPAPEKPGDTQERIMLTFCGLMNYYPNVDGVLWFVKEVFPLVQSMYGKVLFQIVGGKPVKEITRLAKDPDIKVLGRVPDVRPFVWGAHLSIAPIRIARGIQNKVLEAMAMGMPIVATRQAFEGIDALAGKDLMVTEAEPESFAQGITSLLKDRRLAADMGRRARKTVVEQYSWGKQLEKLDKLLYPS